MALATAVLLQDGHGQERVCFHSVRQPPGAASAAAGVPASPAPTVTSKLSAGLKMLAPKAPKQDGGSSSSDDTESDDLLRSQVSGDAWSVPWPRPALAVHLDPGPWNHLSA